MKNIWDLIKNTMETESNNLLDQLRLKHENHANAVDKVGKGCHCEFDWTMISDTLYWIGSVDDKIRILFEGYLV